VIYSGVDLPAAVDQVLLILMSVLLIAAVVGDALTRRIPIVAGYGLLAVGLAALLLRERWLEAAFYLTAIWGSRGGIGRLLILVAGVILLAQGCEPIPFVAGTLYALIIFELGWFGGGDAQLAFGLMAVGRDWWMAAYLFGGTMLLGLYMVFSRSGFRGGVRRLHWVLGHMHAPDEQAIKIPWAWVAAVAGLLHSWAFPGWMPL